MGIDPPREAPSAANRGAPPSSAGVSRRGLRALLARSIFRPSAAVILLMVVLWNVALEHDRVRAQFPLLTNSQLIFHNWLTHLNPRKPKVKWVAVVEVDDEAFWRPPISGTQPTNRRFLAEVARAAAEGGAATIAIDFQLNSPYDEPGDDPIRSADNRYLLEALREVTSRGTPTVLASILVDDRGVARREPGVFPDQALPRDVNLGLIELPFDKRRVPLCTTALEWDRSAERRFSSLALATVEAFERASHLPLSSSASALRDACADGEPIFGGFVPMSSFPMIPAYKLWSRDPEAMARCRNRIVLIGGTWHRDGIGGGELIESFKSPVGQVPGVYLHSNYVEALLDDRVQSATPLYFAIVFDLAVGVLLYLAFHSSSASVSRLGTMSAFLAPLLVAYVAFANLGRYLDFVLPLGLCFLHLGIEHVREYVALRNRHPRNEGAASEGS